MNYQLYFVRADGRYSRMISLEFTSDAEAIDHALDMPCDGRRELWRGGRRISTLLGPSPPPPHVGLSPVCHEAKSQPPQPPQ
jgi:hypothetical protein